MKNKISIILYCKISIIYYVICHINNIMIFYKIYYTKILIIINKIKYFK
jgi:hypothetical protein